MVELTDRQKEDKRFIENPGHWPRWPSLPIVKRGDNRQVGFLMDMNPLGEPVNKHHESLRTIHLANPWSYFVDMKPEDRKRVEKKTYNSVDEMLADGWYVD